MLALPAHPDPDVPDSSQSMVTRLRSMVAARTQSEGRTDSPYPGLRYYKFASPIQYQKRQILKPGVVVVLQGSKTARLAHQRLTYDEMTCLVLGGETICNGTIVTASPNLPYLAIHLDLPPGILTKVLIALSDTCSTPCRSHVKESFVSPVGLDVIDAFTRLLPATDSVVDRCTIAPLIVEEIVVRLLRSEAAAEIRDAAAISRSAMKIQRSIQFIQANVAKPLSVSELANQIAMSPSHYAHSFRQVAGMSPMRYLREVRLDEARALLLSGSVRPGDVAALVGFESVEHFTREFRRRFEASPTEYIRRMQGL